MAATTSPRNDIITISTGTLDIAGTITTGTTGSQFTFTGAGTMNIGGSFTSTPALTTFTGSTVNYDGATQTARVATYYNLTISGSGVKTFVTTPTVNGILSMEGTATITSTTGVVTYGPAATLQYNTASPRTATLEEWITPFAATGGVIIANTGLITANAAKVFNASVPLTINSGASLSTGNFQVTFGGNFINNGGTFTAGSSPIVIANTMATQSIAGFTTTGLVSMTKTGGIATFTGNVNGAGLTINGSGGTLNLGTSLNHTFTGVVTLTAGTLNGGSSTLHENATSTTAWGGVGTVFVPGTGTVDFGGGAQTISATGTKTFNNLTLSGTGAKTTTGVTVNGTLLVTGTAAVTVSVVPTYGAASTLQYKKGVAFTAGVEWPTIFTGTGGIIIDSTGTITMNSAEVLGVSVPLTIDSGASLSTGNFQVTFGGNFINNGGTFTAGSSPIVIANTMATQSIAGFTTTGLVSMTKTGGIATFTGNVNGAGLTINGSGGTLNLGTSLNHTFTGVVTLTAGTLNGGSSTLHENATSTTAWNGTGTVFSAGTGTVDFGGAAQTISATATTFNNLTMSGSGIKTIGGTVTVATDLTVGANTTLTVTGTGNIQINTGNLILNGLLDNSGTINIGL
ncbi:MAG: hypothetical protein WCI84_00160 [Bacteroidota bacterium]